jgi:hypothetical protein
VIATEHGMRMHAAAATIFRGWALADEGRGQEGLAEMSRVLPALEGFAATTWIYSHLADSYRKNGRPEEGLTTVATALRNRAWRRENSRARALQSERRATAYVTRPTRRRRRAVFALRSMLPSARRRDFTNCGQRPAWRDCLSDRARSTRPTPC